MSTNFARAKYQEIYDVNTVSNSVSVIGIHTPVGAKPRQMLAGFFTQFRKYKYLGCSVVATPAARLPLDVMNIAIEAGQTGANPKDVFNPILVRGCHGDNLNGALNSIYRGAFTDEGSSMGKDDPSMSVVPSGSLTWEQMYYRMLQDPSFKKFSMSSGIKLSGLHPMIYNVATDKQLMPTEKSTNVGKLDYLAAADGFVFNGATSGGVAQGDDPDHIVGITPQFFTNKLQNLGWLDTQQIINSGVSSSSPAFTMLPKLMMAVMILPPAYRVSTAMRFVITHYFEFKEFNTSLTLEGASNYYDWLSNVVPGSSKSNDTLETVGTEDSIEIVSDGCF